MPPLIFQLATPVSDSYESLRSLTYRVCGSTGIVYSHQSGTK